MNQITVGEEIYAIATRVNDLVDGTTWIGNPYESLQASLMKYNAGKDFRIHHHILNPRIIKRTQESFVVIKGKIAIDIYDNKAKLIGTLEAEAGDAIFVYRGGHGVRILEDAILYEIKAGQFSLVSEDKEFLND